MDAGVARAVQMYRDARELQQQRANAWNEMLLFGTGRIRYAAQLLMPARSYQGVWEPVKKEEAMYDVTIHPVLNGYLVTVGCQQAVFADRDSMFKEIARYLDNPQKVEKEYRETAINKFLMEGPIAPPMPSVPQGYPG